MALVVAKESVRENAKLKEKGDAKQKGKNAENAKQNAENPRENKIKNAKIITGAIDAQIKIG